MYYYYELYVFICPPITVTLIGIMSEITHVCVKYTFPSIKYYTFLYMYFSYFHLTPIF